MKLLCISVAALLSFASCGNDPYGPTGYVPETQKPEEKPDVPGKTAGYAEGADISWVTQMEADGQKFYTADGKEMECTALMKELGLDAIRLRVWVDPDGGWCGKDDVVAKAKRAQNLGMRIMIDFHYSDTWADPSKQVTPSAWASYDLTKLAEAVSAHTSEVLQALKDNGVEIEWVQIGNEVNSGMLHPLGKVQGNTAENFITLTRAGRNAARKIYPEVKTIIHVSNGHDEGLFDWFFGLLKTGGAEYDIIGMSLYPAWWENNGWCDWKANADRCIANIETLASKYAKPVMLCEFGMPVSEAKMSREALQHMLEKTKEIEQCAGLFWWEPQTDGIWKPSSYNALGWGAYDKGAFKSGKATEALEPFDR